MPTEVTKAAGDDGAMRLELLARIDILAHHLRKLVDGIESARAVGAMFPRLEAMMSAFQQELDALAASVAGITATVESAVTVIGDIAGKFNANANDPTRVRELAAQLDSAKVKLGEAIAANTPGAPPVVEETPKPADPPAPPADGGGTT